MIETADLRAFQGHWRCRVPWLRHLAFAPGVARGSDDRLQGAIIERLMCFGEVDFGRMALELGAVGYDFRAERPGWRR